jgi:pimeloyl-ACP methyl ester carboxylesterase
VRDCYGFGFSTQTNYNAIPQRFKNLQVDMTTSSKFGRSFWLRLLITLPIGAYLGIILFQAVIITLMMTIPLTGRVCCLDIPHEDMSFQTADGLRLAGWHVPSQNGATIILIHAYYGSRSQTLLMAQMLHRRGYGLLLYDQRASGESQGSLRSLGQRDIPDVALAVSWLEARAPGDKIGLVGCSMGGAIGLAAAARDPRIDAVVADAPSPLSFDEARPKVGASNWLVSLPVYTLYYSFISLANGTFTPYTTVGAIPDLAPRPLLFISTGAGDEIERVRAYFNLARGPRSHWNIPASSHCAGPVTHPVEYEQRLADFFNATLLEK